MAAPTEAQLAHIKFLESIDMHSIHKTFRNAHWKPHLRRNKNLKTMIGDVQKREASLQAASLEASAAATDDDNDGLSTSGDSTPAAGTTPRDIAQASMGLAKMVLAKNTARSAATATTTPVATYTNIESAPSLAHPKRYCDITGLPAPYVDPKTRLRYHNKETFGLIRSLPQGVEEMYLEARNAHTVLK
ncbi:hypothetical protein TD95_002480 [Thielaviopsis punctulata]|uniref:Vps72/YL1 C-terminal domain-containing protein n=1 Tax=Thielaviopsis punctulata TaxID=72032 RepID=A0A0F4ZFC5_9PEZI|nr:hypothetical protein TD95_002480 [Thielaviopsis punctulata]